MKGYIEERAMEIARYIIDNNTTVRQAAKHYGISKSTVHMVVTIQNDGKVRLFGWLNRGKCGHSQVEIWECFLMGKYKFYQSERI